MGKQRTTEEVRAAIVAALTDMSKAKAPFHAVKIIRKHRLPTRVSSALNKMGVIETGPDGSRLLVNKAAFKAAADAAHREQAAYNKNWIRQKRAGLKAPKKSDSGSDTYEREVEFAIPKDPDAMRLEAMSGPLPMTIKLDDPTAPKVRFKVGRFELRW